MDVIEGIVLAEGVLQHPPCRRDGVGLRYLADGHLVLASLDPLSLQRMRIRKIEFVVVNFMNDDRAFGALRSHFFDVVHRGVHRARSVLNDQRRELHHVDIESVCINEVILVGKLSP